LEECQQPKMNDSLLVEHSTTLLDVRLQRTLSLNCSFR
jgi:hypothetical protein